MAVKKRKADSMAIESPKTPTIDNSITLPKQRKTLTTSSNVTKGSNSKAASNTRTQTSFLSLPCELRQAILVSARPSHRIWSGEKELIRKRATILRKVHPDIINDVDYAETKWMNDAYERIGSKRMGMGLFRGQRARV
jgi:hypothetical protein